MAGEEGRIRRLTQELCALSREDWLFYIFAGDPLSGKISDGEKLRYGREAADCGRDLAEKLRRQGDLPMEQQILAQGGRLTRPPAPAGGPLPLFASFTEPDSILVYSGNARATDELRQREGLEDLTGAAPAEEVLLAHELFHLLEYREPDLYTRRKHLLLWKIGRWENRSSIFCLSEIAAMAFAEAMTGLRCSVYVLDFLMLYVNSPQAALKKRQDILDFVRRRQK